MNYPIPRLPADQVLLQDNFLDFNNDALTTFIYLQTFDTLDLEREEISAKFLFYVLTPHYLRTLMGMYLAYLKENEEDKFKTLSHDYNINLQEVLESFSRDLHENYKIYREILNLLKKKYEEDKNDPLDGSLNHPFFKAFCDGLALDIHERVFLFLNLAQKHWGWLFPQNKNERYKSKILALILSFKDNSPQSLARKMNNKFLALGLFSAPWEVAPHVSDFFDDAPPLFSLRPLKNHFYQDLYHMDHIAFLNQKNLPIMSKLVNAHLAEGRGCFLSVESPCDFRNGNFLSYYFGRDHKTLYQLHQEVSSVSPSELQFYLYALSIKVSGHRSLLFLPQALTDILYSEEREMNLQNLISSKKEYQFERSRSLCAHVKVPLILSLKASAEKIREKCKGMGINILYSLTLKIPEHEVCKDNLIRYFVTSGLPENYIQKVVDTCLELKIDPSQWQEMVSVLRRARCLTVEEVEVLLKNHFGGKKVDGKIRKNACYSLDALNTSEKIQDVIEALENAAKFQQEEYDDESGTRLLLKGMSGTGKTAFVEEVSKRLEMPLKIIRGSEILGSYVGQTEQNIKNAFESAAREHAILLIDEADSFIHPRGDNVNHHNDSKVNEFLVQMERFPGILFCNTNLPENLDKATDRRFNFKIDFNPLTRDGVALLCKNYFGKYELSPQQVDKIYQAGDVTPGDFGALRGKIKYLKPEVLTADYITGEMCKVVSGKERSWEHKKIGFMED